MSQYEKLMARFKSQPKDFSWNELAHALKQLGFREIQGSGSRVKFFNEEKNV